LASISSALGISVPCSVFSPSRSAPSELVSFSLGLRASRSARLILLLPLELSFRPLL
jgi:hypothetical protein